MSTGIWRTRSRNEAQILLDEKSPSGVVIVEGNHRYSCDLLAERLEQGRASQLIYYPLCGGRVYLRNPAKGRRTALEAATEFLRNQVWGGEKVIVLFHHLLADRYRETSEVLNTNPNTAWRQRPPDSPPSGTGGSRIRRPSGDARRAGHHAGNAGRGKNGMSSRGMVSGGRKSWRLCQRHAARLHCVGDLPKPSNHGQQSGSRGGLLALLSDRVRSRASSKWDLRWARIIPEWAGPNA